MKIALIGPGCIPIPPKAYGAVEIIIWDMKCELEQLGHEVLIINTPHQWEIIKLCNEYQPDFVHIHLDVFYPVIHDLNCKNIAITSHHGYIRRVYNHPQAGKYRHIFEGFKSIADKSKICCLSKEIKQFYIEHGYSAHNLKITPNGAREDLFNFNKQCLYPDKSICLALIEPRKRQVRCRTYEENIYFAGRISDGAFQQDSFYLGEWSKQEVYEHLTDYANLILLSDGEADPLVTKEALMAGLGVVVSEHAAANLDATQPFINIIPDSQIDNTTYVKSIISKNREYSIRNRDKIRTYAVDNFSWKNLTKKYLKTIAGFKTFL